MRNFSLMGALIGSLLIFVFTAPIANAGVDDCVDHGGKWAEDGSGACMQPEAPSVSSPSAPVIDPDEAELQCAPKAKTANLACNTLGTDGMSPGEAAMTTMMTNQLVTLAGQVATAGKNASAQCGLQAKIQGVMGAINAAKGAACKMTISSCVKACDAEAEAYDRGIQAAKDAGAAGTEALTKYMDLKRKAKKASAKCEAQSVQFMALMMQSIGNAASAFQNNQCAKEMAAFENRPVPTYSPIALPNPTDCTDPNNQTLTCFCSRPANAKSAMCGGFNPGGTAGGAQPTTPGGGPGGGLYNSAIDRDAGDLDPTAGIQGKPNSGGGGDGIGNGGGSAPSGGGLASLGGGEGGPGAPGDPKSAITGTSGGQGGGLTAGGGGAGGGLAKNGGAKGESFLDKFNLRKFLPGSKYPTRGIAGMSVKSVDGITGPMGPSIWEKATKQYQEQIQKQNVILDK